MAMMRCVGAGMEVMDGMHAGQSRGGRMSGDTGALPGCKVMTT